MEERKDIEHALAASLKRLVLKEPFEKITIKQITDGAGVIRVTFYNHFQDKYDLLEWILNTEVFDPVRILRDNNMVREAVVLIFSKLLADREFYSRVVGMEGQNSFRELVYNATYRFIYERIREHTVVKPRHPWMKEEYIASYYAQSMTFVLFEWIQTGMMVSPEEMAVAYEYIATRSLGDVIEELEGKSPDK